MLVPSSTNQDTDRSGLTHECLRSEELRKGQAGAHVVFDAAGVRVEEVRYLTYGNVEDESSITLQECSAGKGPLPSTLEPNLAGCIVLLIRKAQEGSLTMQMQCLIPPPSGVAGVAACLRRGAGGAKAASESRIL